MSNRIYLNDEDIKLILAGLRVLHSASIINPSAYPHYALASKQRIDQIKAKLHSSEDSTNA